MNTQFAAALADGIKEMKEGHLDIAADIMLGAVMDQGIAIKTAICRNGPELVDPIVLYAGPTKMAMVQVLCGFAGPEDTDDIPGKMVRETLQIAQNELNEEPVILLLCSEIMIADPQEGDLEDPPPDLDDLNARGLTRDALHAVAVHRHGDDYRISALILEYRFADGEVQFNPNGSAYDTVYRPDSWHREVGSSTTASLLDFLKGVNDGSEDREPLGTGAADQVAEHLDAADGAQGDAPSPPQSDEG